MTNSTDDFLAHFGVKGMHWGQTRERGSNGRVAGAAEKTPEVTVKVQGTKVATSGGHGLEPHEDAIKSKVTKQRIAGSGLNAVGNKELKDYLERADLEQRYSKLSPQQVSKGEKYTKKALGETGKFGLNVVKQVAGQMLAQTLKSGIESAIKK